MTAPAPRELRCLAPRIVCVVLDEPFNLPRRHTWSCNASAKLSGGAASLAVGIVVAADVVRATSLGVLPADIGASIRISSATHYTAPMSRDLNERVAG